MRTLIVVLTLALILGMAGVSLAEQTARTAVITEAAGTVEVKAPGGKWTPAQAGTILNQGDIVRTKSDSRAVINVDSAAETATVEIKSKSQLKMAQLLEDKVEKTQNTLLDLAMGEVLIEAKKLHSQKSRFEVKTPTSVVGVRGTQFSVSVEALE